MPPKIYELYEQVVKECEHCSKTKVRPVKSSVSGLRANVFGDLIFVDHTDVKIDGKTYVVFVIIDATTNFLWAYPQKSKTNEETIETIREWLETFQCSPKSLCADMAFGAPEFEAFFKEQKIRPLLTGPATPWAARAEAANRLFKQYLAAFLAEIDKDPRLRNLPPKSLIRRAATARNTTVTFGGKHRLNLLWEDDREIL